jgi:hypothetical protein
VAAKRAYKEALEECLASRAAHVNELENDPDGGAALPDLAFLYSTGQPIAYSAGILVESLRGLLAELDPQGRDAALQRMGATSPTGASRAGSRGS